MDKLNRVEARELTRQIIRDNLPPGETEGSWSDTAMNDYLQIGMEYAYDKERTYNKASYLRDWTFKGNGTDLPDMPPDFNGVYQIVTEQEGVPYDLIALEVRHDYVRHTKYGFAYYEKDYRIGVLPELEVGDTALMYYYRNFVPWADDKKTDLHKYSCKVACFYGGLLALKDRGDVNINPVQAELLRWEALIPHTRIRSRNPYPIRIQQRWKASNPRYVSYQKP